jgi:2OG-Fe(II) oxygenase superfamily
MLILACFDNKYFNTNLMILNEKHRSSTLPEVGGHTNFRNANVHVKPLKGSAIFFSYMDPETGLTDNHFTEHSGCPVIKGEKKIVTQWIRYGVDEANPWDSFNTRKYSILRQEGHFLGAVQL